MPHVDEGTLHALLDGALMAEEPTRADGVRAHLRSCADCRARLDQAAELREAAGGILAELEPRMAPDARPDFAEVLARRERTEAEGAAATPGDRWARLVRADRRARRLAWAASLVLALGTGYLIGERFGFPGPATEGAAARPVEPSADLRPAGDGEATPPVPAAAATGRDGAFGSAANEGSAPRGTASPPRARASADAPAADQGPLPERRPAAGERPGADLAASQRAAEPPSAVPPPALLRSTAPSEARARLDRQELRREARVDPEPISVAAAEDLLGGPVLRLPGAELGALMRVRAPGGVAVRSGQHLPGDLVVVVTQYPAGRAAPDSPVAGAATGEAMAFDATDAQAPTITVEVAGFLLSLQGTLSADALRELGRAAEPVR